MVLHSWPAVLKSGKESQSMFFLPLGKFLDMIKAESRKCSDPPLSLLLFDNTTNNQSWFTKGKYCTISNIYLSTKLKPENI